MGSRGQGVGMSFDTTAANTGHHSGACVLLERKLGRGMLYFCLPAPHSGGNYGSRLRNMRGPYFGPDIQVFRRFQRQWNLLNKKQFQQDGDSDENCPFIEEEREALLGFAMVWWRWSLGVVVVVVVGVVVVEVEVELLLVVVVVEEEIMVVVVMVVVVEPFCGDDSTTLGDMEQQANLIVQQTTLSAQREERMVALMGRLTEPGGAGAAA
ncbi:hypothetical protein GWK47_041938 [Chionoecetes opilio]|uniref:Uncharacterized protein n=1 Tax=Chionoecetes opilio TaxID=41210 RepID=A0A8J4YIK9_CHIOP|nr:hypothetical protein GWK47_041938 [Chionoecetes opilio]